jgi:hypothetical protein
MRSSFQVISLIATIGNLQLFVTRKNGKARAHFQAHGQFETGLGGRLAFRPP